VSKVQKSEDNKRLSSTTELGIGNLLDALPFSAQLIDSNHKIVAVNETLKQSLGMEEEQLIGAHCSVVIHGLNVPPADCPLEEALQKGKPIERDLFDSKNSRWINASVYPTPIMTTDNVPIYLHFLRDITDIKNTANELSRSLEHHKALCDLLQNMQYCHNCKQIMDTLIDQVLSLSWLGMASTAVGFMSNGGGLRLTTHRNVAQQLLVKCNHLALGECLCGKVAQTGRHIICSSGSHEHSIKYEGMKEHHHAVLPIMHKERTLGVLTLYLNPGNEIDDSRLGFLQAATAVAGVALDGQLSREKVLKTQEKYLSQVISSQEDERKRVAGDLHDQLCQSLSAILLDIQSNESRIKPSKSLHPGIKTRLRDLIDYARQMAMQLHPAILDDFGLESALASEIEDISKSKEISIDFQSAPSGRQGNRFPKEVEIGFYRVAMEAIDNAVSHAEASHVSVILMQHQNKVILLVEDNGCGFNLSAIRSDMDHCRGLIEMKERMTVLGGSLRIESAIKNGTTVRAELQVDAIPKKT